MAAICSCVHHKGSSAAEGVSVPAWTLERAPYSSQQAATPQGVQIYDVCNIASCMPDARYGKVLLHGFRKLEECIFKGAVV